MAEKAGGKIKLVFVGGKSAPRGYAEGRVYLLSARCESFDWFVKAPEEAQVGKIVSIVGRTASGAAAIEGRGAVSVVTDTSIPFEYSIKVEMQFIGGPRAPGNIPVGTKKMLPLRYARFPWWQLVHPLPESLKVAPAPAAESVIAEGPKMPDEVFERALTGGLGREIPLEKQPEVQADMEDLGEIAGLVEDERKPVEISPEKLESEEAAVSPLEEEETPLDEAKERLLEMSVKDLRMIAKAQNLKNYSQLRKLDLVDAILAAGEPSTDWEKEPIEEPMEEESSPEDEDSEET